MISSILSAVKTAITGITGVKKVGAWAGDVQDLLTQPQNTPGLHIVYPGATFAAGPASMGSKKVDSDMKVQILLIVNSLKSPDDAAETAWGIIEAVRGRLVGLGFSTGDYCSQLWPTTEDLVFSDAGLLVYGLNYTLTARV